MRWLQVHKHSLLRAVGTLVHLVFLKSSTLCAVNKTVIQNNWLQSLLQSDAENIPHWQVQGSIDSHSVDPRCLLYSWHFSATKS